MKSILWRAFAVFVCFAAVRAVTADDEDELRWKSQSSLKSNARISDLNAIANCASRGRAERAKAVFTLFANYIKPGARASDVHKVLRDTRWVKQASVERINNLGGWVPVDSDNGDESLFRICLFPDKDGSSDWEIYLYVSSNSLDGEYCSRFLRGEKLTGDPKIGQFALCFPETKPESMGRMEQFGPKGIHVYEEN
jgi:hypothetical protein